MLAISGLTLVFVCLVACIHSRSHPRSQMHHTNMLQRLRYDPKGVGDFCQYGILPFFQGRLNVMAGININRQPNRVPTALERHILSVLGSHGLVAWKTFDSDRTALATYLLNSSLSKVPRYQYLDEAGVDSILVVPPTRIEYYKQIFRQLMQGLPPNGAPCQLSRSRDSEEYEVERTLLQVEFIAGKASEVVSDGGNNSGAAQIKVMLTFELGSIEQYLSLRFFGVDDYDIFTKTTNIGVACVGQRGSKRKWYNAVHQMISQLQKSHLAAYDNMIARKLSRKTGNQFTKRERKVLYKPIQFAFVMRPDSCYKPLNEMRRGLLNPDVQMALIERAVKLPSAAANRQLTMVEVGYYSSPQCNITSNVKPNIGVGTVFTNADAKKSLTHIISLTLHVDWDIVDKEVAALTNPVVVVADSEMPTSVRLYTVVSASDALYGHYDRPLVVVDGAMLYETGLAVARNPKAITGIIDPIGDLLTAWAHASMRVHFVASTPLYEEVSSQLLGLNSTLFESN